MRYAFDHGVMHRIIQQLQTSALRTVFTCQRSSPSVLQPCKMPSNVEIKAKVGDFEQFQELAKLISDGEGQIIIQEDIFFNVPNGTLKLRILQDAPSQLIFYSRPDHTGPTLSNYNITETTKPNDLKETLGQALGVKGTVKKQRTLFLVGQTRIHLDKVEDLGCFMELEVVMKEGQTASEGSKIADELMKKLNVNEKDLITCAYNGLLCKRIGAIDKVDSQLSQLVDYHY